MKKISRRAISVLLIAAAVIFGCVVYVLRYIDDGRSWALAFSSANSGSYRSSSTVTTSIAFKVINHIIKCL